MILIDDTPDICQDTANYPKNPPCRNMDRLYDDFKGKLIVLEGIDGSGKTTQRKLLFKKLNELCIDSSFYTFKQSAIVHHAIQKGKWENYDPYTSMFLFLASITDTLANLIIPDLEKGKLVIMDRYIYSVYVRAAIRNVNNELLSSILKFREPDLIFFFDIKADEALIRKKDNKWSELSYWEAGCDLSYSDNRKENWVIYQNKLSNIYKKILEKENNVYYIDSQMNRENILNLSLQNH